MTNAPHVEFSDGERMERPDFLSDHWHIDRYGCWWSLRPVRDCRGPELVLHVGSPEPLIDGQGRVHDRWTYSLVYHPSQEVDFDVQVAACDTLEELLPELSTWEAKLLREASTVPPALAKACQGSRLHAGYLNVPCEMCWRCRGESPVQIGRAA